MTEETPQYNQELCVSNPQFVNQADGGSGKEMITLSEIIG